MTQAVFSPHLLIQLKTIGTRPIKPKIDAAAPKMKSKLPIDFIRFGLDER